MRRVLLPLVAAFASALQACAGASAPASRSSGVAAAPASLLRCADVRCELAVAQREAAILGRDAAR